MQRLHFGFLSLAAGTALAAATIAPAALAGSVPPSTPTAMLAVDPVKLGLAHQIIDLASPPETRTAKLAERFEALKVQMLNVASARFDLSDPDMMAIFDKHMSTMWDMMIAVSERHMPALYDAMAIAYARQFSVEELRQILQFAQTPAGSKFLQSGNEILKDPAVLAVQQEMFEDMLDQFPAMESALTKELENQAAKKG